MKRIISWFETMFSRPRDSIAVDQPRNSVSARPEAIPHDDYEIETSYGTERSAVSQELGKNVLMPDIYADEHVAAEPNLRILDQPSPDTDESAGFNPYDTAVLKKKPETEPR